MKFNHYTFLDGDKEIAVSWKIGKYWLATVFGKGSLGGFKSFRHSKQAILKALKSA